MQQQVRGSILPGWTFIGESGGKSLGYLYSYHLSKQAVFARVRRQGVLHTRKVLCSCMQHTDLPMGNFAASALSYR